MSQAGYTKRRTSSTAGHRRPFWAKTEKSLQVYTDNQRSKLKPNLIKDYGVDNFSYDPDQLKQWLMPKGLAERLPNELLGSTEDWQKAGAAVCTALDRMHVSYKSAMHAAYPDKPTSFSRRTSEQQAVVGAELTPVDSPTSFTPMVDLPVTHLEKLSLTGVLQQVKARQPLGMESPPYTPLDSRACSTPVNGGTGKPTVILPDLATLNSELSPLASPKALTPTSPGFDQVTWETYCNHFEEEIKDAQVATQRVKGYGRTIDVTLFELRQVLKPEIKLAVMEYSKWWESMKPKVRTVEQRVNALEVPNLRHVAIEWDMARAAQTGMYHSGVLESE